MQEAGVEPERLCAPDGGYEYTCAVGQDGECPPACFPEFFFFFYFFCSTTDEVVCSGFLFPLVHTTRPHECVLLRRCLCHFARSPITDIQYLSRTVVDIALFLPFHLRAFSLTLFPFPFSLLSLFLMLIHTHLLSLSLCVRRSPDWMARTSSYSSREVF
jgi:hypothetical protein